MILAIFENWLFDGVYNINNPLALLVETKIIKETTSQ